MEFVQRSTLKIQDSTRSTLNLACCILPFYITDCNVSLCLQIYYYARTIISHRTFGIIKFLPKESYRFCYDGDDDDDDP